MLSQIARVDRRRSRLVTVLLAFSAMAVALSCDKVPLLAPTGSVITIFPAATTVPLNGTIEIVATVIEQGVATAPTTTTPTQPGQTPTTPTTPTATSTTGAGTPVHNGTVVTFTTTLGRIEPSEARTHNGQVNVRFIAGSQSGTATITAFSGGASGKIEGLKIGTAAAERVLITASPQTLSPNGGTSMISARVEDASGAGLPGVPVTFIADAGTLNPSAATTDSDGVARTTLTTSRQTKVTANVAGKTAEVTVGLNPRTGISITGPTTSVSAGVPVTFTVNVAAGTTGSNVQNVVVDFGDGRTQSMGAISASTPVQHTYDKEGTYIVRATATDASNFSETVSTSITILPGQPPSVTINVPATVSVGARITVTATVSGNTSSILSYEWDFGADSVPRSPITTTSNQVPVFWTSIGVRVITVTITQASGPIGNGVGSVNVVAAGGGTVR
jgi:Bacterial Ig-like domain (group 1)/PKD domain